ncbi:hypothetical protein [Candidatus Bartonella washoeensis]|uniref:Uncharacterized protein n=1 Tax=Cardidatus Bartonella washoeensis 085-0475 TaxID=1094564 RepID=J0QL99_9HYPH|nr:hypothetical protein [Bartonella washoeensis]EJF83749.1 hypothetical protein MCW_01298 [Bartonella washoeensis 085-0475]
MGQIFIKGGIKAMGYSVGSMGGGVFLPEREGISRGAAAYRAMGAYCVFIVGVEVLHRGEISFCCDERGIPISKPSSSPIGLLREGGKISKRFWGTSRFWETRIVL